MVAELERTVDTSAWDGGRALAACNTAADYDSICAGKRAGDPALRSSHALPHHYLGRGPNAAGVQAALARFGQTQGLTNAAAARAHLEAHMSEVSPQRAEQEVVTDIVRGMAELQVVPAHDGSLATLVGRMAVFGQWTEIDSMIEGHFIEQVQRGAFAGVFGGDTSKFKPVYEHGMDPTIGRKPLGPVTRVGEDEAGAYYEVALLDTDYNRSLLPGLEAKLFGSSFKGDAEVDVTRYFGRTAPGADYNPEGLDEHVIVNIKRMRDFGPCTFPAYTGTSAGVARSLTDEYVMQQFSQGEGLRKLAEFAKQARPIVITSTGTNTDSTSTAAARTEAPPAAPQGAEEKPPEDKPQPTTVRTAGEEAAMPDDEGIYKTPEEVAARRTEVVARQEAIVAEYPAGMPPVIRTEWDGLTKELGQIEAVERDIADQRAAIARTAAGAPASGGAADPGHDTFQVVRPVQRDIFDEAARWREARGPEDVKRLEVQDAQRAIEVAQFAEGVNREDAQATVTALVKRDGTGELAERVLVTGSPAYQRAFAKVCRGQMIFTSVEQAAVERAFTLASTGFPVVFSLDPTVIRTSSYVINPMRAISRVETITGTNEWRGVTSGAVVATYEAEATEAVDQTPTLTQPAVKVQRAQTFVPFSREADADWDSLQNEMAGLFQEAKDILEATQFLTGAGTTVFPQGILTGLTTTQRVQNGTTGVFAELDLLNLQNALPPRARAGTSTFLGSLTQYNRIRALDTAGGNALWVQLADGLPPQLLGMRAYELSTMTTTLAGAGNKIMLVGDFAKGYLIVDRLGMDIELIPHLFGATNRFPTGQRGLWAMWRNSAIVLDPNRFRYLETV